MKDEAIGLRFPNMVGLFVRFEIAGCFKPADACVSITQIIEMRAELVLALVMIPREGRVFECAVHPLDLAICQRVFRLGSAMFNAACGADHVEPHGPGIARVAVA